MGVPYKNAARKKTKCIHCDGKPIHSSTGNCTVYGCQPTIEQQLLYMQCYWQCDDDKYMCTATTKQHAIVSIQQNIVTRYRYPDKFIPGNVIALSYFHSYLKGREPSLVFPAHSFVGNFSSRVPYIVAEEATTKLSKNRLKY